MPVVGRIVNWTAHAADAVQRLRMDGYLRMRAASALQSTDAAIFPDIAARTAAASSGRAALQLHNRCLRAFDTTDRARTEYQRSFQNALTRAAIYSFFGAATDAEMGNVARENGWKLPIKQEVAITMPRRYGKTEGCGQWLAAAMLSMRGRKMAIFAPGKRQACMLLDVVKANVDLLAETLGIHVQRIKDNETGLWIQHKDGTVNRLQAYPCKINIRTSARGCVCARAWAEGCSRGPVGCTTADT
jgi:hypothetical protein